MELIEDNNLKVVSDEEMHKKVGAKTVKKDEDKTLLNQRVVAKEQARLYAKIFGYGK